MINKAYDRKVMDDALANKQCHLLFSLSQLIFFFNHNAVSLGNVPHYKIKTGFEWCLLANI